jgi:hypothetical protein
MYRMSYIFKEYKVVLMLFIKVFWLVSCDPVDKQTLSLTFIFG